MFSLKLQHTTKPEGSEYGYVPTASVAQPARGGAERIAPRPSEYAIDGTSLHSRSQSSCETILQELVRDRPTYSPSCIRQEYGRVTVEECHPNALRASPHTRD